MLVVEYFSKDVSVTNTDPFPFFQQDARLPKVKHKPVRIFSQDKDPSEFLIFKVVYTWLPIFCQLTFKVFFPLLTADMHFSPWIFLLVNYNSLYLSIFLVLDINIYFMG